MEERAGESVRWRVRRKEEDAGPALNYPSGTAPELRPTSAEPQAEGLAGGFVFEPRLSCPTAVRGSPSALAFRPLHAAGCDARNHRSNEPVPASERHPGRWLLGPLVIFSFLSPLGPRQAGPGSPGRSRAGGPSAGEPTSGLGLWISVPPTSRGEKSNSSRLSHGKNHAKIARVILDVVPRCYAIFEGSGSLGGQRHMVLRTKCPTDTGRPVGDLDRRWGQSGIRGSRRQSAALAIYANHVSNYALCINLRLR